MDPSAGDPGGERPGPGARVPPRARARSPATRSAPKPLAALREGAQAARAEQSRARRAAGGGRRAGRAQRAPLPPPRATLALLLRHLPTSPSGTQPPAVVLALIGLGTLERLRRALHQGHRVRRARLRARVGGSDGPEPGTRAPAPGNPAPASGVVGVAPSAAPGARSSASLAKKRRTRGRPAVPGVRPMRLPPCASSMSWRAPEDLRGGLPGVTAPSPRAFELASASASACLAKRSLSFFCLKVSSLSRTILCSQSGCATRGHGLGGTCCSAAGMEMIFCIAAAQPRRVVVPVHERPHVRRLVRVAAGVSLVHSFRKARATAGSAWKMVTGRRAPTWARPRAWT